MPNSVVSVVEQDRPRARGQRRLDRGAHVAPARISVRAWSTSRMALFTTRPMSTTKPIMVSRSSVWAREQPQHHQRQHAAEARQRDGQDHVQAVLDRTEQRGQQQEQRDQRDARGSAPCWTAPRAGCRHCLRSAPRHPPAAPRGSAAPRRASAASTAWPNERSLGGLTLRPMVRCPSTRRRPPAPTVDSTRTSSPRGSTLPAGVAIGVSASASGESHLLARRIMSRRRSPSKYSPTNMPSPSARTTVPMSPRDQPTSLRRRSSGESRSSGLGHLEALEGLHLGAGHLFLDQLLGACAPRPAAPGSPWTGSGSRCCGRRRSRRTGCPARRRTACPESRPASPR